MANTPNYNFIISEGSDIVNPLTQIFPNFTSLDSILKGVENKTIGIATELKTGTVHAITRIDVDAPMFRFQATANFETNDTFTVDGLQVSALDVSGQNLANGAFVIGSMVLCELRDNLLTVYVSGSADAQTLDGHPASYYATKTEVDAVNNKANANHVLIVGLNEDLTDLKGKLYPIEAGTPITFPYTPTEDGIIHINYRGNASAYGIVVVTDATTGYRYSNSVYGANAVGYEFNVKAGHQYNVTTQNVSNFEPYFN